ncbi:ABC transporter permease [Janibacter sp. YB324]|uniref:ABC transporter permease n=1 Tax=Janibacter sp. YB324 TaxID=2761047 RepID=UPI001624E9A1|nr:ABC transporter permease [Janibacter sp. YB324]QNF94845.1 ABC transporter permease [Janibacter sp. YB324]
MGKYIVRRLLQMIPVIIFSTFLIYAMVFAMPGDPTAGKCGERPCPPAYIAEFNEKYHLNDPLLVQYYEYAKNVVQGDLGENQFGNPVAEELGERFQVTAKLGLMALVFEGVLGIAAGVLAGLRKGGFIDNLVLVSTLFVISVPVFVIGTVLQYTFGLNLELLPSLASGTDPSFVSLIMPAIVLGSTSLAYIARLMRTNIAENVRSDYVRTAKAKGLSSRRIIGIHTLRNSMIPVVTFMGYDFGALLGGAIVTEGIFNIQGVGGYIFQGIRNRDGIAVVGAVTALVIVYLLVNLLVDLLYGALDPRISND